jgi:hypothetical protein
VSKLPDTLSGLLRVAVEDAKKCEADPRYELDMGVWHTPKDGADVCLVCMAGAVMAQRLEVAPTASLGLADLDDGGEHFFAINAMRSGYLEEAASMLRVEWTSEQETALGRLEALMLRELSHARATRLPWERYEYYADQLELIERMAT